MHLLKKSSSQEFKVPSQVTTIKATLLTKFKFKIMSHGKFDSKGEELLLIDFKLDEQLSFYSCIPLHVWFE
jgi:hypothetical protein